MPTAITAHALKTAIEHTITAHTAYVKAPGDTLRSWDQQTPYVIHPIWCAMTLLTETMLSTDIRSIGYQVLLWHDTLEETTLSLPADTSETVKSLVGEMTFASFHDEVEQIWERSDMAKLLKLYDKVSNLLDGTWMTAAQWNAYVEYTHKLTERVADRYGELNIVKIARAVCIPKPNTTVGVV